MLSRQVTHDVIVGIVLFLSCAYILVLNPVILGSAQIPEGHVFAATALIAAVGTIAMGLLVQGPSVVAPGMGLNSFIAAYVVTTGIPWRFVLGWLGIAYVLYILFIVLPGMRRNLLDSIPPRIFDVITSSIGGMILASAFHLVVAAPQSCAPQGASATATASTCVNCPVEFITSFSAMLKPSHSGIAGLFLIATALTVIAFFAVSHWAHVLNRKGRVEAASIVELLPGIALLASVPLTALVAARLAGVAAPTGSAFGKIAVSVLPIGSVLDLQSNGWIPSMVVFLITVFFVLVVDVSGSAYVLLRPVAQEPEYSKRVQRGFVIEAVAGLGSVLLQSSPAICFTESNAARGLGAVRGLPATVCGSFFLLVAVGGLVYGQETLHLLNDIPKISFAPLLAALGVVISREALISSTPRQPLGTSPVPPSAADESPLAQLQRLLPKLLALGGAFAGGLTIGIAAGIFLEFILAVVLGQPAARDGFFIALTGTAVVSFVTMLWVFNCI